MRIGEIIEVGEVVPERHPAEREPVPATPATVPATVPAAVPA
jgi:hypothetical protein